MEWKGEKGREHEEGRKRERKTASGRMEEEERKRT
jgi:hypothetical protein